MHNIFWTCKNSVTLYGAMRRLCSSSKYWMEHLFNIGLMHRLKNCSTIFLCCTICISGDLTVNRNTDFFAFIVVGLLRILLKCALHLKGNLACEENCVCMVVFLFDIWLSRSFLQFALELEISFQLVTPLQHCLFLFCAKEHMQCLHVISKSTPE